MTHALCSADLQPDVEQHIESKRATETVDLAIDADVEFAFYACSPTESGATDAAPTSPSDRARTGWEDAVHFAELEQKEDGAPRRLAPEPDKRNELASETRGEEPTAVSTAPSERMRTGWEDGTSFADLVEVEDGEKKYEKILRELKERTDHFVTPINTMFCKRNLERLKRQLDEVEQGRRAIDDVTASCSDASLDLVCRFVELGGDIFDLTRNWMSMSPWFNHVLDDPLLSGPEAFPILCYALSRRTSVPDLDDMPRISWLRGLLYKPCAEWSIVDVLFLVFGMPWGIPLFTLLQFTPDQRAVLLQPTLVMFLVMQGKNEDGVLFLLHLRDAGQIRFNLGHASWLGPTAARLAKTEKLQDALLFAQLTHDIAHVSTVVGDDGKSPRAPLVAACRAEGCTRKLMERAIAYGRANVVLAAVKLAEAARLTEREHEATAAASDVIAAALWKCQSQEAVCALFWMSERGLSTKEEVEQSYGSFKPRDARDDRCQSLGIKRSSSLDFLMRTSGSTHLMSALCNSGVGEPFANPMLQALCKQALCPDGPFAARYRDISVMNPLHAFAFTAGVISTNAQWHCFAVLVTAFVPRLRVAFERELAFTPGILLPNLHGSNLGFLVLCTKTALSIDWARWQAYFMTLGLAPGVHVDDEEDWLQRGGALDLMCAFGLVSSLVCEAFEWQFKGRRYIRMDNLADVVGQGMLLFAFVLRVRASDKVGDNYSPESLYLTVGLTVCWFRTLSRIVGEFQSTGILLTIVKETFLNDIFKFTMVLFCMLTGLGFGAAALYTKVSCDEDNTCFLELSDGAWSFSFFIFAQLVWPLIGVDDVALDEWLSVSAGDRSLYGPILMCVFGVLCVIVMLNILIAMLSSTCACGFLRASFPVALMKVRLPTSSASQTKH